jgi:PAS domain S-box-containing protein
MISHARQSDITEHKLLEQQILDQNRSLTESAEFMSSLLEASTQHSIIAKDLDGTIIAWNEGARRNYGYSADDMVGKHDFRILHVPEDVASGRIEALLRACRETGKAEGIFERVRRDGVRFTALLAVTLRRDVTGLPVGYVMIETDITQKLALEKQLLRNDELEEQNLRVLEATRQKSEFLANMSHELRTPLNGIIGLTELMHDEKVGPIASNHREYLGDILTSSNHLLQLINDVLDLAKVESGTLIFRPEPVGTKRLIGEVLDILRAISAAKRIQIDCEIDPAVEQLVADPAKLKQVLYNYLSNALKFTSEGGRIVVRASPDGSEDVRIEVIDTGIGIRPEDFDQLFVEFSQLDAGSAKKYAGTGLGLALTRRIVEAQGGRVGVTSVFGRGTTFFAVLPRLARSLDLAVCA